MSNTTMSERLKETLGMIENQMNTPIKNPQGFQEVEVDIGIGSRGGREIIPFKPKSVPTTIPELTNSDISDDYITSRNLTHTLIEMAGGAIQGALDVALETQHPKAFSIFNELATTMRGLSKDLLEMQKIYKEINAEKEAKEAAAKEATVGVQNNLNITTNASLAEILKMMKDGKLAATDDIGVIDV